MIDLTIEEIIEIHDTLIELDKGTSEYLPGVRDIGTLENLIEYKLVPENDVFKNAAHALCSITYWHSFNNGNKRTGFGIASIILESERYHITASQINRLNFLLKIARYETTHEDIERWLRENTHRMGETRFRLHSLKNLILGDPILVMVQAIALLKNMGNKQQLISLLKNFRKK